MPTKCTITGTVVSPDGTPVANAKIDFGSAKVRPMTPLTIAPESATATTDEAGALTVELYPGEYSVRAMKTGRQRYPTFSITVPEAASAVLADIIDLPPPVSLDAAGQAVLAAQHLRDEAAGFASDAEVAEFEAGEASGQAIDAAGVALGAAGVATGKAGEAADSAAAALASKIAVDLGALETAKAQTDADRLAAAGSAAAAGTAAGAATGAANMAGMARTAAETARDAAIAAGVVVGTYASTTAGLAAVAEGAKFWALVGTDTIQQYTKTGGVAVAVTGLAQPTAQAVLAAKARAVPWLITVDDATGTPILPVLDFASDRDSVWLNGRQAPKASVSTNHGDGSFTMTEVPSGLSAGITVFVEAERTNGSTPSGSMFSIASNPISLANEVSFEAGLDEAGAGVLAFRTMNRVPASIQQYFAVRYGSKRAVIAVPATGAAHYQVENGAPFVGAVSNAYLPGVAFTIGRRVTTATPNLLTNATVKRVIAFPGKLTQTQIDAVFAAFDTLAAPAISVYPNWLAIVDAGNGKKIPSFHFDPKRGRCWYNGAERKIADVLDTTAAGWKMRQAPRGLVAAKGITIIGDVQPTPFYTHDARPSGYLFHASKAVSTPAGLQERLQLRLSAAGDTIGPGGLLYTDVYSSRLNQQFPSAGGPRPAAVGGGNVAGGRGQGILRYGVSQPPTGKGLTIYNASPAVETTNSAGSYVPQDYFEFGANYGGTSPLANASLEQIIIYSEALTKAEIEAVGRFNEYGLPPLFFFGDSLNNVSQPAEMLMIQLTADGCTYLPWLSDGRGSMGVSFFAEFVDAWASHYDAVNDYVPVLIEGGFDWQSLALNGVTTVGPYSERDIQVYLADIFDSFRETRGVIMEPNSNLLAESDIAGGVTTAMIKWRATMKNIAETYPRFWAPIMALCQAQAADDAEYTAIRADGRMPASLRGDGIHPTWGATGAYVWIAKAIRSQLAAQSWSPRKP